MQLRRLRKSVCKCLKLLCGTVLRKCGSSMYNPLKSFCGTVRKLGYTKVWASPRLARVSPNRL